MLVCAETTPRARAELAGLLYWFLSAWGAPLHHRWALSQVSDAGTGSQWRSSNRPSDRCNKRWGRRTKRQGFR